MTTSVKTTWTTPSGDTWILCDDMLKQTHLVIAGTTGSGKSTLLHSVMFSALIDSPAVKQFVLIDLKGVELRRYRTLPHVLAYADEPETAAAAIKEAEQLMRSRLNELKRTEATIYNGSDIYLIIDEIAILMQTAKAKVLEPLSNIMRLGRAARVHVIGATQNPSRSRGGGLPAELVQNCTASVALRCRSAVESRQIIGRGGAELLPVHGRGLYWNPSGTWGVDIPMTADKALEERITYWKEQIPVIEKVKKARKFKWFWN